jgi:hypothetical protein
MLENHTSNGSQSQLAAIPLSPVLAFIMGVPVAPREAVERTIERAIEELDAMDGDCDLEDATGLEDAFETHAIDDAGPGCLCSDTGEENGDQEGIDEREPDYDAEVETWAHWMDHAPETHVGHRPGHTDQAHHR